MYFWRQICVIDFESVSSLKNKSLNVTWFQFQLLYCSNEGLGRLVFVHYGGESPGKCLLLLGFSLNVLELTLARKQMSNFARWAEQYTICTICNPSLTIFLVKSWPGLRESQWRSARRGRFMTGPLFRRLLLFVFDNELFQSQMTCENRRPPTDTTIVLFPESFLPAVVCWKWTYLLFWQFKTTKQSKLGEFTL